MHERESWEERNSRPWFFFRAISLLRPSLLYSPFTSRIFHFILDFPFFFIFFFTLGYPVWLALFSFLLNFGGVLRLHYWRSKRPFLTHFHTKNMPLRIANGFLPRFFFLFCPRKQKINKSRWTIRPQAIDFCFFCSKRGTNRHWEVEREELAR